MNLILILFGISVFVLLLIKSCIDPYFAYSVIIHTRKATVFPILVNIGLFVVVTIIDKTPPVLYMTGSFIFVVQMIVISCISGNGSSSVNARFNIQAVSVGIACLLAVIMFIASRIVPLKSYQKAGYFDKVYSYVSSVYSNVYDRIVSSGGVGNNIANDMIDNGRLGKLDSIHYSYQEMVQADVEADAVFHRAAGVLVFVSVGRNDSSAESCAAGRENCRMEAECAGTRWRRDGEPAESA